MHFYPGVAEYQEPDKEPYRVFLNEDTIRSMDPSFAGRPIFVEHVDGVDQSVDELRKEADGWVIESFFNAADGKHWVKFIVVSERAERAIKNGMRLSNAYIPKNFRQGGLWNGVQYAKEVTEGEYEHLAIVRNPRYEESVIMTPEKFKAYNEEKALELKRLANSKEKGEKMSFKLFKRTKVENSIDLDGMSVLLPKSGKEVFIADLIKNADETVEKVSKNEMDAHPDHRVKMHDGSYCNVGELLAKHKAVCDEMEKMKSSKETEMDLKEDPASVDVEGDLANEDDNAGDDSMDNAEDDADEKDKKKENEDDADDKKKKENEEDPADKEKKKNELEAAKLKKQKAKEKADALKNAHLRDDSGDDVATVELMQDQVARGRSRYGSA